MKVPGVVIAGSPVSLAGKPASITPTVIFGSSDNLTQTKPSDLAYLLLVVGIYAHLAATTRPAVPPPTIMKSNSAEAN